MAARPLTIGGSSATRRAWAATAPLRALPRMVASDGMLIDAMDEFRSRAMELRRSDLVRAALIAVDLLERARPEWSEPDCRRAIVCLFAEVERARAARRSAA